MPLPVRSASVRSTNTDSKLNVPRTPHNAQLRRTQPLRASNLAQNVKANSIEASEPSVEGSETSSRIPSPFKKEISSENATRPRTEITRPTQRPLGHSRQRSTVLPANDSRPKFGHSRSTSTVSTNTTATSHTAYTANTSSTSGSDQLRVSTARSKLAGAPRSLGLSTRIKPEAVVQTGTSSALSRGLHGSPFGDNLQSELLQLAIVYDESSRGLLNYQRTIERSLDLNRAELKAIRDNVTKKQQAFYHALNLEAVNSWLQEYGYQGTCQLVQNLSVAVRDLSNLEHIFGGEDGLAAVFQAWTHGMEVDELSESLLQDNLTIHLEFDQHLGPELKRFKHQIASVQRIFSNLPLSSSESALATTLKLHISLANILHQQSQIMLLTGEALVSKRNQWINSEKNEAIVAYIKYSDLRRMASFLK